LFEVSGHAVSKPLFVMVVFAVLMMAASLSMIRAKKTESKKIEMSALVRTLVIGAEGLIVGGVTGFVGAGGGFLIIPALVVLVGMSMKIAVGTSLFIIATKSLIGFFGDLQTEVTMDWNLLLMMAGLAIVGLFIGVRLSSKVPEKALKKGFGYFVLVMGAIVLFDQLRSL
jgi:uncharacterized membrane protein YfcA